MIAEVSQKQAYIFQSNKLSENIKNSNVIEWVTSYKYFEEITKENHLFTASKNLVYSGGGHIILEYETKSQAISFSKFLTKTILAEQEGLELFIKVMEFNDEKPFVECLKILLDKLEEKKSLRKSSFYQGNFGIENLEPNNIKNPKISQFAESLDADLTPKGYKTPKSLDDIGVAKNKSSYIAVVHIDGNGMGKRVKEYQEKLSDSSWEECKEKLRCFSKQIDDDYKDTYKKMLEEIRAALENNSLKELNLEDHMLPCRRIISAGDDICFITEGRIGIECARIFLEKLAQESNNIDGQKYYACAGIAIVHVKYPFYRAYQLADALCNHAKRYASALGNASVLDFHLEQGEVITDIDVLRQAYTCYDGNQMELRPYWVVTETPITEDSITEDSIYFKEKIRDYQNFCTLLKSFSQPNSYAFGKLKGLRAAMKRGEIETDYYMKSNLMDQWGISDTKETFVEDAQGIKRAVCFDAMELMDTFLFL